MGMIDREKVIKGLECCLSVTKCGTCPYNTGNDSWCSNNNQLLEDALALLTPRILTLEDLMGFDGAFLIEYNPSVISREANWAMFHFMDEKQVHIWRPRLVEHYAIAQYGVTWRCWNVRPSQAEMEAMPWNGSK